MQIHDISISLLREYDNNPRNNDGAVDAVAASIREFGFKVPVVVDSDNVIVCGHTRVKGARKLGMETVPCIIADDLTPEQIKAFRLADNKVGELAGWEIEKLGKELSEIDMDMSVFGFDAVEFEEFSEVCEDEIPDVDEEGDPITKLGDIWQLGRHRLMCGDSTSVESVAVLMDGALADMILTDPPYNVAYEGGTKDKLAIMNDNMDDESFRAFLQDAFCAGDSALKKGGAFYIWHADSEGFNFRYACKAVGWEVKQCLIWNKNALVLGRQDYQWKHEPCLYGWKSGAPHYFVKNRKLTTVLNDGVDIDVMTSDELRELIREITEPSSVINENKPTRNGEHPTMKPVRLLSRQIRNSSRIGEKVLDLFGGSGSTLIACEQLNRTCYMMELDERYVSVIINRYLNFTGRKDEIFCIRDGQKLTYDEVFN